MTIMFTNITSAEFQLGYRLWEWPFATVTKKKKKKGRHCTAGKNYYLFIYF